MPKRSQAYAEAGVDLDAAEALVDRIRGAVDATHTKGVISDIGGFGGLFKPDLSGMGEPILVAATDGVGTKIKLAAAFSEHAGIGKDLVAMSANDVLVQGAKPLFFLDYFATGKLDLDVAEAVVSSVASACQEAGCALLGGETAEMPDMDTDNEYDLAGFCVGMVDKDKIVDGSGVRVGDALIGLASTGVHSNGFSLVRKLVDESGLGPEDVLPGTELTAKQALLMPTAIYVKPVLNVMRDFDVHGMVHITGGGFHDNIPRVLPSSVEVRIDFGSWPVPPVFPWIKDTAAMTWDEMLHVFNCGIGYVLAVDQEQTEDVLARLNQNLDQPAWRIGSIAKRTEAESCQVLIDIPGAAC